MRVRENLLKLVRLSLICAAATSSIALAGNATVSWDANTESDLSGYKIYYGIQPNHNYQNVVDVGDVTSFTINNLENGRTYYFAVTAYDFSGNESSFSTEVSADIGTGNSDPPAATPPELVNAVPIGETQVDVIFNEALDKASAENVLNYSINNGVQVLSATLDASETIVHLITSAHQAGRDYVLSVSGVKDKAGTEIAAGSSTSYSISGGDSPPALVSVVLQGATQIDVTFSEPLDKASAEDKNHYAINLNMEVKAAILSTNLVTVHLLTSKHQDNLEYTLTVNNIKDADGTLIPANSSIRYLIDLGGSDTGGPSTTFSLFPNYPNPFNPETQIRFYLEKGREVELKVYNPLGQLIKSLITADLSPGYHSVVWDGTNGDGKQVPTGVYMYVLEVSRELQEGSLLVNVAIERRVRKMTLIR